MAHDCCVNVQENEAAEDSMTSQLPETNVVFPGK